MITCLILKIFGPLAEIFRLVSDVLHTIVFMWNIVNCDELTLMVVVRWISCQSYALIYLWNSLQQKKGFSFWIVPIAAHSKSNCINNRKHHFCYSFSAYASEDPFGTKNLISHIWLTPHCMHKHIHTNIHICKRTHVFVYMYNVYDMMRKAKQANWDWMQTNIKENARSHVDSHSLTHSLALTHTHARTHYVSLNRFCAGVRIWVWWDTMLVSWVLAQVYIWNKMMKCRQHLNVLTSMLLLLLLLFFISFHVQRTLFGFVFFCFIFQLLHRKSEDKTTLSVVRTFIVIVL